MRPEQPTSVTYRSSSPGGVSGAKHPHQIFRHWALSPGEISLSSPPVCSSVVSSPTAMSIAQLRSRLEDDIAQRRPPSHSLNAACRSQAQSTSSCLPSGHLMTWLGQIAGSLKFRGLTMSTTVDLSAPKALSCGILFHRVLSTILRSHALTAQ